MSGFFPVFAISGGPALFIFGMNCLTEGLKRCTGDGLGTLIGFLVQSSAATVMPVGFTNAGLMTLKHSKLERRADGYTEQTVLAELDAGDYLDNQ